MKMSSFLCLLFSFWLILSIRNFIINGGLNNQIAMNVLEILCSSICMVCAFQWKLMSECFMDSLMTFIEGRMSRVFDKL